jgi:hypothetical protein
LIGLTPKDLFDEDIDEGDADCNGDHKGVRHQVVTQPSPAIKLAIFKLYLVHIRE